MNINEVLKEMVTTVSLPSAENQIPKRLFGSVIRRCGCGFKLKKKEKKCPECGQLINWKKEEKK